MDQLPREILVKILSYLNTYDLMKFCVACGNSSFLKDSNLNRSVDFSRRFELHNQDVCSFITTNLNFACVKSLNINYLYWIPASDLRGLIKQLENLEVLYAIDTELGLKVNDIYAYVKLKKLAVSIRTSVFDNFAVEASKKLKALNSLCLKIIHKKSTIQIYNFFQEVEHLEELWICDEAGKIDYSQIVNILTNLKRFVITSTTPLARYNFEHNNLFKIFESRRNGPTTELIYENILNTPHSVKHCSSKSEANGVKKSLEIFKRSLRVLPCNPAETKLICLGECVENIYFKELNFCYPVVLCKSKYISAAVQILSSRNSEQLRRLRLRSCLFQISQAEVPVELVADFRRLRKETNEKSTVHSFSTIAENLKNIKELEIESCPICNGDEVLSAYNSIQIFPNLKKLTLEIPVLMNGEFLKEVFMKCPDLESLYLICVIRNEEFIANLYQNLKYAVNLKDFRLDHADIIIDRLIDSFHENKKLLRVFIKCEHFQCSFRSSLSNPLHVFIKNNPQLIFLFFVSKELTNDIQKVLDYAQRNKPAKVFRIENIADVSSFSRYFPLTAHHDIIFKRSNISNVNIDEF